MSAFGGAIVLSNGELRFRPQSFSFCGHCDNYFMMCVCNGIPHARDYNFKSLPPPPDGSTPAMLLRRWCSCVNMSLSMGCFTALLILGLAISPFDDEVDGAGRGGGVGEGGDAVDPGAGGGHDGAGGAGAGAAVAEVGGVPGGAGAAQGGDHGAGVGEGAELDGGGEDGAAEGSVVGLPVLVAEDGGDRDVGSFGEGLQRRTARHGPAAAGIEDQRALRPAQQRGGLGDGGRVWMGPVHGCQSGERCGIGAGRQHVLGQGDHDGAIRASGEYRQQMEGFADLTDAEVAAILTYIRRSWGNNASAVTEDEVWEIRQDL